MQRMRRVGSKPGIPARRGQSLARRGVVRRRRGSDSARRRDARDTWRASGSRIAAGPVGGVGLVRLRLRPRDIESAENLRLVVVRVTGCQRFEGLGAALLAGAFGTGGEVLVVGGDCFDVVALTRRAAPILRPRSIAACACWRPAQRADAGQRIRASGSRRCPRWRWRTPGPCQHVAEGLARRRCTRRNAAWRRRAGSPPALRAYRSWRRRPCRPGHGRRDWHGCRRQWRSRR